MVFSKKILLILFSKSGYFCGSTNLIFDFEEECLLNIYDVSGVKVYSKQLNRRGLELINLPTENFDAGLYFLVVYKENSVLAKEKLIVQ